MEKKAISLTHFSELWEKAKSSFAAMVHTHDVATQSKAGFQSAADKTKQDKSGETFYYIVGPDTDTTAGTWTGTDARITEYYDGLTVLYTPAVAGVSPTTTLDINGLGALVCYYNNTTKLTTHYAVGTPIFLTYIDGVWKRADYDSNTNTQIRVYRQTSGYNADYPLLASRTLAASIGTVGTNSSYSGVYGVMNNDATKIPTVNPNTGEVKAKKLTAGTLAGTDTAHLTSSPDKICVLDSSGNVQYRTATEFSADLGVDDAESAATSAANAATSAKNAAESESNVAANATAAATSASEAAESARVSKEYLEQVKSVSIDAQGYYTDEDALKAAVPIGEAGWWAVNGDTDSIWVWDVETSAWVDSHDMTELGDYYTRTQVDSKVATATSKTYTLTVSSSSWSAVGTSGTDSYYRCSVYCSGMTSSTQLSCIELTDSYKTSADAVAAFQTWSYLNTAANYVYFYSATKPTATFAVTAIVVK
jgi:hypothetical protein